MSQSMSTTPFWFSDPKILIHKNRIFEVFPSRNYSFDRKLNSLVRLSLYFAIVMYILTKTTKYTVVPIIVMSLTWLLHYKQIKEPSSVTPPSNTPQSTMNSMNSSNVANSAMVESECLLPTKDNPFMNPRFQDYGNNQSLPAKACKTYNNVGLQGKVEEYFNEDLYRDVGDIFGKNNSQRQFYTVPGNQVPNDQWAFANWLYGTPPTCKEGNKIACSTNWVGPGGPGPP